MSLAAKAFMGSALAAAAIFAAACLAAGTWVLLPVPVAAAAMWLLPRGPRWPRLGNAAFAFMVCGCGVGLLAGLPAVLMLVASLAAISAWDLDGLVKVSRGAANGTPLAGGTAHPAPALDDASAGGAAPASPRAAHPAPNRDPARRPVKGHLARLSLILGAGALLGAAALFLRLHVGFAALLGLAVLLAIGLTTLVRSIGKG